MRLGLVVEGHGEVQAVPVLVRRMLGEQGVMQLELPAPLRLPRGKMLNEPELARAVELMARKTAPDGALLVLLDADTDCPAELGPRLLSFVQAKHSDRQVSVVVAKHEFEAWFLAAAESLRGHRGLPADLTPPADAEGIRDAKGWLGSRMPNGYSETLDQPALAAVFDLDAVAGVPSFNKLQRDLARLAREAAGS